MMNTYIDSRHDHLCRCPNCRPQPPEPVEATPTSTLQLACPTCGDEIEVEWGLDADYRAEPLSLRTNCFHPITREQAYDLMLDEGARQAELATERAGERP